MKKLFISILGLFMLTLSGQCQYFKVQIEQNGKIVSTNNHEILLNKAPFKIILTFYQSNYNDFHVNSSFRPVSYNQAIANKQMHEIEGFYWFGLAGVRLAGNTVNKVDNNERLYLSDEASSYWPIDNNLQIFNETRKLGNNIECTKVITKIIDTNTDNHVEYNISQIPIEYLYMVYILEGEGVEPVGDSHGKQWKQIEYLKLSFN